MRLARLLLVTAAPIGVVAMLGCGALNHNLSIELVRSSVAIGDNIEAMVVYDGRPVTQEVFRNNELFIASEAGAIQGSLDTYLQVRGPGVWHVPADFVLPAGMNALDFTVRAFYNGLPATQTGTIVPRGVVPAPTPTPSPVQRYVDPSNPVLMIVDLPPGQVRVTGPEFDSGWVTVSWDGTVRIGGLQYGGIYTVWGPNGQVILTIEVLGLPAPPTPTPCPPCPTATPTPTPTPTPESNAGAAIHIWGGDGR